jgi:hypothetical protein
MRADRFRDVGTREQNSGDSNPVSTCGNTFRPAVSDIQLLEGMADSARKVPRLPGQDRRFTASRSGSIPLVTCGCVLVS